MEKLFNMKHISEYYEIEVNIIKNYITNYIQEYGEDLDAMDGFNLCLLYSNFNSYVRIIKTSKISFIDEYDEKIKNQFEELSSQYPKLMKYVIRKYETDIRRMKKKDPEQYNKFREDLISSKGFSTN